MLGVSHETAPQTHGAADPIIAIGMMVHATQNRFLRAMRGKHVGDEAREVLRREDVRERIVQYGRLTIRMRRETYTCDLECRFALVR